MYCIKCGSEIFGGEYSCPNCGLILNESPLHRMQMMIDQNKELKQKMDEYSAANVIQPTKQETIDTLDVNSVATPVSGFPQRELPGNTKEATMVTDLSNSTILNPKEEQDYFN